MLRRVLFWLFVVALILPLLLSICAAVAWLLAALGDEAGSAVLQFLGVALGILWALDLISLVLVEAMILLDWPFPADEPRDENPLAE